MSKLCKAIRRSGTKKGAVCNNKITNNEPFCFGHMLSLQKSAIEGEKDERHLQGEGYFKEEDTLCARLCDGFKHVDH